MNWYRLGFKKMDYVYSDGNSKTWCAMYTYTYANVTHFHKSNAILNETLNLTIKEMYLFLKSFWKTVRKTVLIVIYTRHFVPKILCPWDRASDSKSGPNWLYSKKYIMFNFILLLKLTEIWQFTRLQNNHKAIYWNC